MIFCRNHGCDGAPGEILDVFDTSRLHCWRRLQPEVKGGEGTMDAGPSHSRPMCVSRACSRDGSTHHEYGVIESMFLHRFP